MIIDDKITDQKLQYHTNMLTISALSSDIIDKQKQQGRVIEQAKFAYFPLGKSLENQTKTMEDQGGKQITAIESRTEKQLLQTDQKSIAALFSKDILAEEALDKLIKIIKIEKEVNRDDLIFKTDNKKG